MRELPAYIPTAILRKQKEEFEKKRDRKGEKETEKE